MLCRTFTQQKNRTKNSHQRENRSSGSLHSGRSRNLELALGLGSHQPPRSRRGIPDIEFLVPDEQVIQAKDVLINAGHRLCQDMNCPELSVDRARVSFRNIVPDYHFQPRPQRDCLSLL